MEAEQFERGFQIYKWKPIPAMLQEWQIRPPIKPEDQLQNLIWSMGGHCEAILITKTDKTGGQFFSARLSGPPEEQEKARPIAQDFVNRLWAQQHRRPQL